MRLSPFLLLATSAAALADVRLPALISDNMVLLQDGKANVWGWAEPGEKVTVKLGDVSASATTTEQGKWSAKLEGLKPQSSAEMTIAGKNTITIKNVAVGEVWLASGQSNMEWSIKNSADPDKEIAACNYPDIRVFTVTRKGSEQPLEDVGGKWEVAKPENAGNFSAVGFFFSREIHQKLKAPVGLIHSSWGGTPVETWMPISAMKANPAFGDHWKKKIAEYPAAKERHDQALQKHNEALAKTGKEVPVVEFESALKEGRIKKENLKILVRPISAPTVKQNDQFDTLQGLLIPKDGGEPVPFHVKLDPEKNKGLQNDLKMHDINAVVEVAKPAARPPRAPDGPDALMVMPAGLYNGMIAPVAPYTIRGAIWYQGESNAGKSNRGNMELYGQLFPTMILAWRYEFARAQDVPREESEFPFLFVQLANYFPRRDEPTDSYWAQVREAQLGTLEVPRTGMAVAIDIGEDKDIHPKNKQEVGRRLALSALAQVYFQEMEYSGPLYGGMQVEEDRIRLNFSNSEGLKSKDGGPIKGFAIAGEDQKFVWADAKLEGDHVVVSSPKVKTPVAVRYAWADNPECNLVNAAGLPASPFRTDKWPQNPPAGSAATQ